MDFGETEIIRYAVIILLALFFTWLILKAFRWKWHRYYEINEFEKRAAGKRGERKATELIKSVCREDDYLFTNVKIENTNEEAELDNVIVNKYGVYIIEVKSYSGALVGSEDDYVWDKYHVSEGGNTYVKPARNPIRQVSRQAGVLHRHLEYYGIKTWIEGYAIILGSRSPVSSDRVLRKADDIDKVIHTKIDNGMSKKTVESICRILG